MFTLGPAYNEQIDAKKTAHCRGVLVVTELFNIAVNYFDAKKATRCRRVLVVTELVVSGIQCNYSGRINTEVVLQDMQVSNLQLLFCRYYVGRKAMFDSDFKQGIVTLFVNPLKRIDCI